MFAPTADVKQLNALNRADKDPDLKTYLELCKSKQVEMLTSTNEHDTILRLQGSIRMLEKLLEQMTSSSAQLSRRKQ